MKYIALSVLTAYACQAALTVYPLEVTLQGPGTRQRFAVTATDSVGVATDVTAQATFTPADSAIADMLPGGIVRAAKTGKTKVKVTYEGESLTAAVEVLPASAKHEISFVKDVVPIFTRSGCAGANCHGSIRGKGGFKLSLFGYEPNIDYEAILKADNGRRVNLASPAESLILRKPTFQVPHGGGIRFKPDSLEYAAIRDWLAAGAKYDSAGAPRIASLSVEPRERRLTGFGSTQRLIVMARYTDGAIEDVTGKVQFTSNNDAVASVSSSGRSCRP